MSITRVSDLPLTDPASIQGPSRNNISKNFVRGAMLIDPAPPLRGETGGSQDAYVSYLDSHQCQLPYSCQKYKVVTELEAFVLSSLYNTAQHSGALINIDDRLVLVLCHQTGMILIQI